MENKIKNNKEQSLEENNININDKSQDKINNNQLQQKEINFRNDNRNINTEIFTQNNSSKEKIKITNNSNNKSPSLSIKEKLENIFLEREKTKLKYNKQAIPEQLKYNSDDDEDNLSGQFIPDNDKQNNNEAKNDNSNMSNNNNLNEENQSNNNNDKGINGNSNKNTNITEKNMNENNISDEDKKNNEYNNNELNDCKKVEDNNNDKNENLNDEKKDMKKNKSFKRKFNCVKNEEEGKGTNNYQLLLAKKMKNIIDEDEEEENEVKNENIDCEIKKEFNVELSEKKDERKTNNNNLGEEGKEINKDKIQIKEEIKEIKKNEETFAINEKMDKNKELSIIKEENHVEKNISNDNIKDNKLEIKDKIEKNIENKKTESESDKNINNLKKLLLKDSGIVQFNQNNSSMKKNSENSEKSTQLPAPQKKKLTINLRNSYVNEIHNKDANNYISPIMSPKVLAIKNNIPKTISRYSNNKDIENDKGNIIKLLELIKNKKKESEKIDKEKEKAEEMYKRSKSHTASRNLEEMHKFKTKAENIKTNNQIISTNKEGDISPKNKEVYSKKNKANDNNKYIINHKEKDNKVNNMNKKNLELKNIKCDSSGNILSKTNSISLFSPLNKNLNRIVVNNRMKKNLNKENINKPNINDDNVEHCKDTINKYPISRLRKTKSKEKIKEEKSEIEMNSMQTYEKPACIYYKDQYSNNRSIDMDNFDSSNVCSNKINTNVNSKPFVYNSNSKVYNKKKSKANQINSVRKTSNGIKKDFYLSNKNYIYNYNYHRGNNNNSINNVYYKKKSSLIESNIDTNASSSNLSKSIKNKETNQMKNNFSNKSKENIGKSKYYYSVLPQNNTSTQRGNLKVNKKTLYVNDNNQDFNNNNESENFDIIGRNLISEKKIFKKINQNNKNMEKCKSFVNKNHNIKNYNNNIKSNYNYNINHYSNSNNKENLKKLELHKDTYNKKDILMNLDGDENDRSLHNIFNVSYKNMNDINYTRKTNKKIFNWFKIEDLLVIEEKLSEIIECIRYGKDIKKRCFDLWNYYLNSSLFKKIEKIFDKEAEISIVKLSINYELLSLIICYEFSVIQNLYEETNIKLLEIMELNYNSLIGFFKQIINNIDGESNNNIWATKLINIFEHYSKNKDYFINNNDDILLTIEKIKYNNENIDSKIQNLLNYYMTENNSLLIDYYLQIKTKTYEELTMLFQKNILTIENEEGSLIASLYLRNNSIFAPLPPPYLKTKNRKKYTLVLDLDETLVNFKIKKGREGFVRLRPFLFGFLEEVSQYYELIIFTSSTEAYANSVIEAIEHDKKYFDYVFYRQHTIIVGNDFVKDLTRIGRPLNSTIIIDNMPQNFRFQKENGINIKPFWGQDSNDKALYDLIPILLDIAKSGGDVRISLNNYKDEIIGKITSSISMNK